VSSLGPIMKIKRGRLTQTHYFELLWSFSQQIVQQVARLADCYTTCCGL